MKVAVSYLSTKFSLKDTVNKIDKSTSDYIHVDLMDGKFAGTKNFTTKSVVNLLGSIKKPLDIHLMTLNPSKYYKELAILNTDSITFHIEAVKKPESEIESIKNLGLKVGIAINPETPLTSIMPYLKAIEKVLVMSVHPGYGGQEFIMDSLSKIDELLNIKEKYKYNFEVCIDGGINEKSIAYLKDKDIDTVISGSFICQSDNFDEQIARLR